MNTSQDNLYGPGSKPIRRKAKCLKRAKSHGDEFEVLQSETVTLSCEDSIDSSEAVIVLHCGHLSSDGVGMQCSRPDCDNLSCRKCSEDGTCQQCLAPICKEHRYHLETSSGRLTLCPRCHAEHRRRLRWRAVLGALASPFIERPKE
jgi:hypothetical protein